MTDNSRLSEKIYLLEIQHEEIKELYTDTSALLFDRKLQGGEVIDIASICLSESSVEKLCSHYECDSMVLVHILAGMPLAIPGYKARFKVADNAEKYVKIFCDDARSDYPQMILRLSQI